MTEEKDLLAKATEALANTEVPSGPPQEVVNATLAKLAAEFDSRSPIPDPYSGIEHRASSIVHLIRFAAAAVVLLATGYLIGRLSAPKPPDAEELYAAVAPAIQRDLLEPMARQWLLALANYSSELEDKLRTEFRADLNQFAVQTLAASGAATNQVIRELVESFQATQVQQRRSVATALRQLELDRMRDKAELTGGLETLAVLTGDELHRTKQDIVQLLAYSPVGGLTPDLEESPNITTERSKQ
jgi:hypothetical protein